MHRIELKKMREEDFGFFSRLMYDEQIMTMNMGRPFTEEEVKGYYSFVMDYQKEHLNSGGYLVFAEDVAIGLAFLWIREEAELEYMLLPEFWGRGYATEIAGTLVRMAKEAGGVRRICGIIAPENVRSRRVLIRNGFAFERAFEVEEDHSTAEVYGMDL